jgi:rubredoxin
MGVFDEHKVPEAKCPACGHIFNAASAVHMHGRSPKPGDLSVCIECARPLCFAADLSLRLLKREELAGLDADVLEGLARVIVAVRAVRYREALKRHGTN